VAYTRALSWRLGWGCHERKINPFASGGSPAASAGAQQFPDRLL